MGPKILLTEPSEGMLARNEPRVRGDSATRGVSVIAATHIRETRIIRGRVEAPAGLASLTFNGIHLPFDGNNAFAQSIELDREMTHVRLVALAMSRSWYTTRSSVFAIPLSMGGVTMR